MILYTLLQKSFPTYDCAINMHHDKNDKDEYKMMKIVKWWQALNYE